MEVVISLLMFLGDPPILKEHLLMKNVAKMLRKKKDSNSSFKQCRI
jgi:hypothetical protein